MRAITVSPLFLFAVTSLFIACSDDPDESNPNPEQGEPIVGSTCATEPTYSEDLSGCAYAADDYQPRSAGVDTWPACISDDDSYHKIQESVSSIARVQAYGDIGAALWVDDPQPTKQDFLDARILFEEEQGLGSRVARRYDIHYPGPAQGACDEEGVAEANPQYCVGPATLQPILTQAFADGAEGMDRVVNAARIRAALLWFMYVSPIKEATTCTETPQDCDSAWAYYTGGNQRANPAGLAFEINRLAPETHNRIFDGLLAVRCWKNLDNETGESTDLAMRDRAIAQLDAWLLHGMSILVQQMFKQLECAEGDYQRAAIEELRILIPLLDRATRERDATAADFFSAEVQKDAGQIDVQRAVSELERLYTCP